MYYARLLFCFVYFLQSFTCVLYFKQSQLRNPQNQTRVHMNIFYHQHLGSHPCSAAHKSWITLYIKRVRVELSLLTKWRRVNEQRYNSTYSEFWNHIELFTVLHATAIQILTNEFPVPTE